MFKVLNHIRADLSEGSQGSEGDSDEDVLGVGSIGQLVLDLLGVGQQELSDVGDILGLALLVGDQGLGNDLLKLGVLLVLYPN